jgi:SAM-dependent methyltransferase
VDPQYWDEIVEVFKLMKSPMRPDRSETGCFYDWMTERIEAAGLRDASRIDVLLLGVTVELVELPWPDNVHLTAVDRSEGMMRAFWRGDIPGRRRLLRADWDGVSLAPESFDFAIGDGVLNARSYPGDCRSFAARIGELLRPGGTFLLRAFVQPDQREDPATIIQAMRAGQIATYNEFTFRFLTSLQVSADEGVISTKPFIEGELEHHGVDLSDVYARTGYVPPAGYVPPPTPDEAADCGRRVSFPTVHEFEQVLAPTFHLLGRRYGTHSTAQRCPIFGLVREGDWLRNTRQ